MTIVTFLVIKIRNAGVMVIKLQQNMSQLHTAPKREPILHDKFFELLAPALEPLSPFGTEIGECLFTARNTAKMHFIAGQLKILPHRVSTRHNYCYFICNIWKLRSARKNIPRPP